MRGGDGSGAEARREQETELPGPTVDQVPFRSLYEKSHATIETQDGWSLVVTHYKPRPQSFPQPLWGEPLLLVHGFSQNRHTWTSGEFVKNLLFFGIDIYLLELRGHGQSSIAFQRERHEKEGKALPADLDYGWDLDSYFLYDLPAAIEHVKRESGRDRIFYCGHSMGGILGYGLAGLRDDLEGLVTIGAAAELGKGFFLLRLLSAAAPSIIKGLDTVASARNVRSQLKSNLNRVLQSGRKLLGKAPDPEALVPPERAAFRYLPVDAWMKALERILARAENEPWWGRVAAELNRLSNPQRVNGPDIRWLLREGGEREPRGVLAQFARWIRHNELRCYRSGYDFKKGFSNIRIPTAIIFGDLDPIASVNSTRSVYRAAQSEYLLWRPVKGNSHIELTMGHDIRQICYDIKNLIEYTRTHRARAPALPRVR